MEVVRANFLANLMLGCALVPRTIASVAFKVTDEIGGAIIPTRLLPDTPPDQQLEAVVGWLSRKFEPKGEIAYFNTPPGDEPLHTARPDLLTEDTTLRLYQIDPAYAHRTLATFTTMRKGVIPLGVTVERSEALDDPALFLHRGFIGPGEITLSNPRSPHSFISWDKTTDPRPYRILNLGPR